MQFFIACMNVSEAEYSAASNKSVVVRGSFLCQGAYPGQILVQNNASRAAVPVVNISGGTEYFLTAVSGTKTSHAVIDAATGSFTIPIETGIEWTFTAGIKKGGVDIFLCEPFSRTLSYDDSDLNLNITLKPVSEGSGNIRLEVQSVSSDVKTVKVCCSDLSALNANFDFDSSKKALISFDDVSCGVYELSLTYYDENNIPVLIDTESVNVFPELDSDTWVSGGGLSVIDDTGHYKIETSLLQAAARNILYVGTGSEGIAASDSNSGNAYEPLETLEKAFFILSHSTPENKTCKIYLRSSQSVPAAGTYNINLSSLSSIEICGESSGVIINGNGINSVFNVSGTVPLILNNIVVSGGGGEKGGGVFVDTGSSLKLKGGARITGNNADYGGGVYNKGKVILDNAEISDNNAAQKGKQFYNNGSLELTDSTLIQTGSCSSSESVNLDWIFDSAGTLKSSRQVLVSVQTEWIKNVVTSQKIIITRGSPLPVIDVTEPSAYAEQLNFKKNFYNFDGFYSQPKGNGTQYYNSSGESLASYTGSGTISLYQYWSPKHPLDGSTTGLTLSDGYYVVRKNATYSSPISNGLIIQGTTVNIFIEEDCTLTAIGADGASPTVPVKTGSTGGAAGIYLPAGKTLNLYGYGSVTAKGGKGGNASDGFSNKKDAWMRYNGTADADACGGTGGDGGGGAGGGGAGIGTDGANGGAGGTGSSGKQVNDYNFHNSGVAADSAGGNGGNGYAPGAAGALNRQSTVNISGCIGGQSGSYGSGGELKTNSSSAGKNEKGQIIINYTTNDTGSGFMYDYTSGPGGTGGGGGAGGNGFSYGTGGYGGGGGGGGAGGSLNGSNSGHKYIGGHGGSGGNSYGGNGLNRIDDSDRPSASGGSGGAAGTAGDSILVGTLPAMDL